MSKVQFASTMYTYYGWSKTLYEIDLTFTSNCRLYSSNEKYSLFPTTTDNACQKVQIIYEMLKKKIIIIEEIMGVERVLIKKKNWIRGWYTLGK